MTAEPQEELAPDDEPSPLALVAQLPVAVPTDGDSDGGAQKPDRAVRELDPDLAHVLARTVDDVLRVCLASSDDLVEQSAELTALLKALGGHVEQVTAERDRLLIEVMRPGGSQQRVSNRKLAARLGLARQRVDQLAHIALGRPARPGRAAVAPRQNGRKSP